MTREAMAQQAHYAALVWRTAGSDPEVADNLEAAAAELRKTDWQPIETLPVEGGPFLIYWPMTIVGHCEMDLCSYEEYSQIVGLGESPASHWQPLPAPPKVTP